MLSVVLFAAVAFLFAFFLGFAFVNFWVPNWIDERNSLLSPDQRLSVVLWTASAFAFSAACFAGWAWRTPPAIRFHCCFWAGLCLLGLSLTNVWQVNKKVTAGYEGYDILIAPLLCAVTIPLGLILLLVALYLDQSLRLPPRCRPKKGFSA